MVYSLCYQIRKSINVITLLVKEVINVTNYRWVGFFYSSVVSANIC
jgi:hypothetical protein